MIHVTASKLHWNYFVALERDLESVSRYIEFNSDNLNVYSIELAHLLFAASSEVDVLAKLLCKRFAPKAKCRNIDEYRPLLLATLTHYHFFLDSVGGKTDEYPDRRNSLVAHWYVYSLSKT